MKPSQALGIALRGKAPGGKKLRNGVEEVKLHTDDTSNSPVFPPYTIKAYGLCLCLTRETISEIYHSARANRKREIVGHVLGWKVGDVSIGTCFIELENVSPMPKTSALPGADHLREAGEEVSVRLGLTVVASVHSHPNGVLRPSDQDAAIIKDLSYPEIIASPRRLLRSSPKKRMKAFHHSHGEIRELEIVEVIDPENLDGAGTSSRDLLSAGKLAVEADFHRFKVTAVVSPNAPLGRLGSEMVSMLQEECGLSFHYLDGEWFRAAPEMSALDYFLKDGQLVLPELYALRKKVEERSKSAFEAVLDKIRTVLASHIFRIFMKRKILRGGKNG